MSYSSVTVQFLSVRNRTVNVIGTPSAHTQFFLHFFKQLLLADLLVLFQALCLPTMTALVPFSHQKSQDVLDTLYIKHHVNPQL